MESSYSPGPPDLYGPVYDPPINTSFKLDEGFSEDTRSQYDNSTGAVVANGHAFEEWVMAQSEEARADIAYEVLRTLKTSSIAAVVERLTPLLHMDPVQKLPAEITANVFNYLEATTLLAASLSSKEWRSRILDFQLWKRKYSDQGWGADFESIIRHENEQSRQNKLFGRKSKGHFRSSDNDLCQPRHKKRAPASWLDERQQSIPGASPQTLDLAHWRRQYDALEADTDSVHGEANYNEDDEEMPDVYAADTGNRAVKRSSQNSDSMDINENQITPTKSSSSCTANNRSLDLQPPVKPSLMFNLPGESKINWPFLYKQRRRLEENWRRGRYTNFLLPHPNHPSEAHRECVYAIQFVGKWLVSGSRDKTLRVWDLDTRRLRGAPLLGHTQSVLCLQFDPSEGEDVIISGSSDTNVIIWRFSTGEKIQEITQAHHESVLNLRFDHRFLVTCSKDKLIKIWNRHAMTPLDPNYPKIGENPDARVPSYIIDTTSMPIHLLETRIANRQIKSLAPYSLLMSLEGHGAAVNAVQIEGDYIVSASGDRNIKVWSVSTGLLKQTLPGHNKGIACVQFDGKRIVSGSSDNTVRIFDKVTGAPVACLDGHKNLVRTVQAGFGDLPDSEADYLAQARSIDSAFNKAVEAGEADLSARRKRLNAGSSNVKDVDVVGAALPPGGGGSQWGRIVSGSYDESIIIWKRDADGNWVPGQQLYQAEAAHAANAACAAESRVNTQHQNVLRNIRNHQPGNSRQEVSDAAALAPQSAQQNMQTSYTSLSAGIQNGMNINSHLQSTTAGPSSQSSSSSVRNAGLSTPGAQQANHQLQRHAQNMNQAMQQGQANMANLGQMLALPASQATQAQPQLYGHHGSASGTQSQPPNPTITTITTTIMCISTQISTQTSSLIYIRIPINMRMSTLPLFHIISKWASFTEVHAEAPAEEDSNDGDEGKGEEEGEEPSGGGEKGGDDADGGEDEAEDEEEEEEEEEPEDIKGAIEEGIWHNLPYCN
ncbi:MAG: hypothetical protein Q9160_004890 [Pyrenula sp. 1 TL-2023]